MKTFRNKIILALGSIAAMVLLFLRPHRTNAPDSTNRLSAPAKEFSSIEQEDTVPRARTMGNATKGVEMTAEEKADLAKKFDERFRPSVERWCRIYEGRVPFKPEDVTLDKFHSRLGNGPGFLFTHS